MFPFHESFSAELPNAWCIHRWYNLALWADENLNVLYLDADTYINGDIQLLFDIYRSSRVYLGVKKREKTRTLEAVEYIM
jgi:lipopolysaccharide biosynthesis glycosyltransferase